MTKKSRANLELVLFIAPALILVGIFILYPLANGFRHALYQWNGFSPTKRYIGIANFVELFQDEVFLKVINFTLLYGLANLILVNISAIFLANLLSKKLKTGSVLRTLFFSPNVISLVVIGMIWLFVFSTVFSSLSAKLKLPFLDINWFGDPFFARMAMIIVTMWVTSGYLMLVYLAGINSIDTEIIEAANIEGSSGLSLFFRIKLPLLMPSVVISVFWITIYSLKIFDLPFVITGGGPYSSTETLPVNIYFTAFDYSRYGYASAKSMVLLVLIIIITFLEVYYLKKREIER